MQLATLDHINVRTANVPGMIAWYERVLGMRSGERPPFPFPGAWLYVGDKPYVHLVGVTAVPENRDPTLEHFALSGTGLKGFVERLTKAGDKHDVRVVPVMGIVQVNVWDPDGNHIHIDFAPAEGAGVVDAGWGHMA